MLKNRMMLLFFLLCLSFSTAAAGVREYEYALDEPKWTYERTDARIELRTAWACLTGQQSSYVLPDTIQSDSIISDSRIVSGGEFHHIVGGQDGIKIDEHYYLDTKGNMIEVLGNVSANNGQPYSLSPYHYINSDGLIVFNARAWIEMVLWCMNVIVSPWLWFAIVLSLFIVIVRRLKRG